MEWRAEARAEATQVTIRRGRLVGPIGRLLCGCCACSDWRAIQRVHHEAFEAAHRPILGPGEPWFDPGGQCQRGMRTQGGQGGHAAPLASRFHRIPTHFPLDLHTI
jgi:hypothetical protein